MDNDLDKNIESQIQRDIQQIWKQDDFNEYLVEIMDTPEDLEKFKILKTLGGIIENNKKNIGYQTVFAKKNGRYTPVVLTDIGYLLPVKNNANVILKESLNILTENYKDEDGKPQYTKKSDVPKEEHYDFFKLNDVTYKFSQPVFWDDSQPINTVDNMVIHDVINKRDYSKKIFDDVITIIKEYYFHINKEEYAVIATNPVLSYMKNFLGNVFYLIFFGGMGTGKSTSIALLSFLQYKGFFTGKGTVASSCRNIHFLGISLNQDEFEKMRQDEKTHFVNIMNSGFNSYGRYTLTNTFVKDIKKQTTGLKTFGVKTFTCNDLSGFDPSFIDRCHVILSIKTNKSLKNIFKLSSEELQRFQDIRNQLFVYCLFNWKKIVDDIEDMRKHLESAKIFGRETDKNSIILGIIQHFKGRKYSEEIRAYIESKAPVFQLEHVKSMEHIILEAITKKFEDTFSEFIDISNTELYNTLLLELDMREGDAYAPANTKPRKILDSLGLTSKKENIGMMHGGKRIYHINTSELICVLRSNNYDDLLNNIPMGNRLTPQTTLTTVTNSGELDEGGESGEGTFPLILNEPKEDINDIFDNDDELLKQIIQIMKEKPAHEWKLMDICERLNYANLPSRNRVAELLRTTCSDPKNGSSVVQSDENGFVFRLRRENH